MPARRGRRRVGQLRADVADVVVVAGDDLEELRRREARVVEDVLKNNVSFGIPEKETPGCVASKVALKRALPTSFTPE